MIVKQPGEDLVAMPHSPLPVQRNPHRGVFFRSWLRDPFHVASIAPSSRWLAKLMAMNIEPGARVVELGAGTGSLTTAILDRGVRPEDLYLVEQHRDFVTVLKSRFPRAHVVEADAEALPAKLSELQGTVDFVVSGLPILWFGRDKKSAILTAAMSLLKSGGKLHQFTYLGRPPVGLGLRMELGLRATLLGVAPMNLPPAFVYEFARD
jgi:phosphatidylethanolamine/phosphatidyl-N-methylethanolamine N-methyltransferase